MARKAPISLFTSDRGTRYLFLNGGAFRTAYNAWRATGAGSGMPSELSNFAKIAIVERGGRVSFEVKASATHQYMALASISEWADALGRAFGDTLPVPHGAPVAVALAQAVSDCAQNRATVAQFDSLALLAAQAFPAQDRDDDAPRREPAPQPARLDAQPQPAPQPSGVNVGAGMLDAFGDFGKAIHGTIVTVVERAVSVLPKGGGAVHITVPGYTPVALPDGEVTHESFPALLTRCTAQKPKDRNVLLLGPRGSGKTHAAEQVARALGMAFDAVSMSGGTTERAFWGSTTIRDGNMAWKPSRFVEAFRKGGVFLIDELDKADPTVVTALNMATSNGYICPSDSDERIERHPDFIVLAGANALASDRAYTGSTRLDASSLDRFAIMRWDYSPAITARVAAECGDARAADWIVRLSDAMRARIDAKNWRGEVEWGTRTVGRVASWIRAGRSRADAVAMELDAMPANIRNELNTVAVGVG
jgi:MoxR-like ATPase